MELGQEQVQELLEAHVGEVGQLLRHPLDGSVRDEVAGSDPEQLPAV